MLLVIPGLVLLTFWLLIVPVIMLEGVGVFASFGRSARLVRGNGWSVFAVIALTVLVLLLVSIVVSLIGSGADSVLARVVLDIITQTLTAPFIALAWTMAYYRLRELERPPAAPAFGA